MQTRLWYLHAPIHKFWCQLIFRVVHSSIYDLLIEWTQKKKRKRNTASFYAIQFFFKWKFQQRILFIAMYNSHTLPGQCGVVCTNNRYGPMRYGQLLMYFYYHIYYPYQFITSKTHFHHHSNNINEKSTHLLNSSVYCLFEFGWNYVFLSLFVVVSVKMQCILWGNSADAFLRVNFVYHVGDR